MLGNFSYSNPTKLYFGEDSLQFLNEELPKYGKNILLTYGGGSIKANGIYDKVVEILRFEMESVAPELDIKLKVDIKTGEHWGEL